MESRYRSSIEYLYGTKLYCMGVQCTYLILRRYDNCFVIELALMML